MFRPPHRRSLLWWIVGLFMSGSALFFFPLAVFLSNNPSAVSSMTGIGLIGLLLFAVYVIGEEVSAMDLIGVMLIVLGTSTLGYLGTLQTMVEPTFSDRTLFFTITGATAIFAALCVMAYVRWPAIHGVSFGATAGFMIGAGIFLADTAQLRGSESFLAKIQIPHLWVAFAFAILALVVTQFGFLRSRALEVVPATNSAILLAPPLLEMVVYRTYPTATESLLTVVILAGVFLLSIGAAARISEPTADAVNAG